MNKAGAEYRLSKGVQGNLKPFDLHIGDTIKTAKKEKYTVIAIYQHHFMATNGKWQESFTKPEYQTWEVYKC